MTPQEDEVPTDLPEAEVEVIFNKLGVEVFIAIGKVLHQRAAKIVRPERLFHFTDAAGLMSILSEGRMRASCASALNDPSETQQAAQVTLQMIDGASSAFCTHLGAALRRGRFDAIGGTSAYVVSFCSRIDSAFHWLHYGRNGQGIALGFDAGSLSDHDFQLVPILYSRQDQEMFLRELMDAAQGVAESLAASMQDKSRSMLQTMAASLCADVIHVVAPRMKHPAFADEAEWRLIVSDRISSGRRSLKLPVSFRASGARAVTYVHFPLKNAPITEIVLGYSNPMALDDESLRALWYQTIGGTPQVRRSDVPIR